MTLRRPAAVILDMDGTLLDTERVALWTFEATCVQFDLPIKLDAYFRCIGHRGEETRGILKQHYGEAMPVQAFFRAWEERYVEHAVKRPVPVKAGAVELLSYLRKHEISAAVATSTVTHSARTKLASAGLLDYFVDVIGGDQVTRSKPEPDIYFHARSRVADEDTPCWAIEDSEAGVRAAHAAGLVVFQIPDLQRPSADLLVLGHRVCDSLHDVHTVLSRLIEIP